MQILKGHLAIKPVRSLAFSPDGTKLASSARDFKSFLWDLSTGDYRVIDFLNSNTVAFSPDGKTVATGRGIEATLWDIEAEQLRVVATDLDGWHGLEVAFADNWTLILMDGTIRVWDIVSAKQVPAAGFAREEARFTTDALALTPDRKTMATGHYLRRPCVRHWDVEARSLRDEITGPTATVTALAFSSGGSYLAAASGTTLWVWDVASKQVVVKHSINKQHFKDVAFTPDGRFLVFARNDATVSLWDTTSWTQVAAYDFGIGPMVSVACAPDGMRAAVGSAKGKIVVFDID